MTEDRGFKEPAPQGLDREALPEPVLERDERLVGILLLRSRLTFFCGAFIGDFLGWVILRQLVARRGCRACVI